MPLQMPKMGLFAATKARASGISNADRSVSSSSQSYFFVLPNNSGSKSSPPDRIRPSASAASSSAQYSLVSNGIPPADAMAQAYAFGDTIRRGRPVCWHESESFVRQINGLCIEFSFETRHIVASNACLQQGRRRLWILLAEYAQRSHNVIMIV